MSKVGNRESGKVLFFLASIVIMLSVFEVVGV